MGYSKDRELGVYNGICTGYSENSEEDIEEFWNELSECVGSFCRNESVVVVGDLNARVRNKVIEGIVGQHGVQERNESGERLLELCARQKLVVGNSWFIKNDVYKYTWLRMAEERVVDGIDELWVVNKANAWKTVKLAPAVC